MKFFLISILKMTAESNTGFIHDFDQSTDYNFHMLSFQTDVLNSTTDISAGVVCSSSKNQNAVGSFPYETPDIYSSTMINVGTSFGSSHRECLRSLKHDRGLAVDWTYEEQNMLNEGLIRYAGEGHIMKYIKIAALFPHKSARDVALRIRWLVKHGIAKRYKLEEHCAGKRIKERKEKMAQSYFSRNVNIIPPSNISCSPTMHHASIMEKIPFEVSTLDVSTQQLMDETNQILGRIAINLDLLKLQENFDLFSHTRNNIFSSLSCMSSMPGIMSKMPPLPISVNDELFCSIFPRTSQTMPFLFSPHGDSVLKEEPTGSNLL